jgi:putative membrane-bound dehydrogenase-like protein
MKNIAILVLVALSCGMANDSTIFADDGFKSIFDGKTLNNWDGNPKFWSVTDGAITGKTTAENPTNGNTFIIYRGSQPSNFELRLQFRIVGGNSGVQYRSKEVSKWVVGGYQADFDGAGGWTGTLYEERGRGILAKRGNKIVIDSAGAKKRVGSTTSEEDILAATNKEGWNDYTIIANGNHLIQILNNKITIDVTDNQASKAAINGLLALQLHAGNPMTVQFKNIRIKTLPARQKKIALIAGVRSHGYGSHEHFAGCMILADAIRTAKPDYAVDVFRNGWPKDASALDGVDCIVMYADGGGRHPVVPHLAAVNNLAEKGVGIVCIHYGVEVEKGDVGDRFLDWIGGYFEANWSVNPHWTATFAKFPDHPISRGVKPFTINDEWYYHMRFREGLKGVTPILSALPPKESLSRPDGAHSGNPHVRAAIAAGEIQHMAWASENENGGRGFGFTGGHYHWNWADDNFRKVMLNAIVWSAHGEVPRDGVGSQRLTIDALKKNQDYDAPEKFDFEKVRTRLKLGSTSLPVDPRAPSSAIASMRVPKDLSIKLAASEPSLKSLTNLDIDHRGRVWVCEVVNYRKNQGKRPSGDRILILEDTDHDGVMDKQSVFYQGHDVDSAMGICVLGKRVIVSCSPNVLVFTDEDGDDKADKKELLFSKTGQPQHDHSAHSFIFGPDGKYYWNYGNTGQFVHDKDGNPVVDVNGNRVIDNRNPYVGGMIFRCDADGSNFEVIAHNFRNNYEVSVDSFGRIWQSDNDDDGNKAVRINYVIEFGNYGYKDELTGAAWKAERTGMAKDIPNRHWHQNDPGVMPNLLLTGAGSPTGIMLYEGKMLPQRFRNQIIHCDAGPNTVRSYPVLPNGAGFTAKSIQVVDSDDQWFRPADVCTAPDGSIFVTDWYDPGVGGHNMGDIARGRLFRIATPNSMYKIESIDLDTLAGAARALANPNLATRYLAWTKLHAAGAEAEPILLKMYNGLDQRLRARALWLLGKIPKRGMHYVMLAAGDSNPQIRETGIRLARQLDLNILDVVRKVSADSSASVRREALVALHGVQGPEADQLWAIMAAQHDGADRWYLETIGVGAANHWDSRFTAWLKLINGDWQTPAGRDIVWRSRATAAASMLADILLADNTPEKDHPRYLRAFDYHKGPAKDAALEKILLGQTQ